MLFSYSTVEHLSIVTLFVCTFFPKAISKIGFSILSVRFPTFCTGLGDAQVQFNQMSYKTISCFSHVLRFVLNEVSNPWIRHG